MEDWQSVSFPNQTRCECMVMSREKQQHSSFCNVYYVLSCKRLCFLKVYCHDNTGVYNKVSRGLLLWLAIIRPTHFDQLQEINIYNRESFIDINCVRKGFSHIVIVML